MFTVSSGLHVRIAHAVVTFRTLTPIFSAVEYSVASFLSIFGFTKVRSDQVWNKKNPDASKGQDAIFNPSK